jgi:hypothetical protein
MRLPSAFDCHTSTGVASRRISPFRFRLRRCHSGAHYIGDGESLRAAAPPPTATLHLPASSRPDPKSASPCVSGMRLRGAVAARSVTRRAPRAPHALHRNFRSGTRRPCFGRRHLQAGRPAPTRPSRLRSTARSPLGSTDGPPGAASASVPRASASQTYRFRHRAVHDDGSGSVTTPPLTHMPRAHNFVKWLSSLTAVPGF